MPSSIATLAASVAGPLLRLARIGRKGEAAEEDTGGVAIARLSTAMRLADMAEEMAGVGHFRRDLRTDKAIWSEQIYRILGMEPATDAPNTAALFDAMHPEDRERASHIIRTAMAAGEAFAYDARIVRPDGAIRWVIGRGLPELGPDGRAIAVFGVFMDVTEAHLAQDRLRESEARYRTLAENASDLIVQTDLEGRLTYISPAVETLTGYPRDLLLGRESLSLLHPDDAPKVRAVAEAALQPGARPQRVECRVIDRGGRILWFEAQPTPLRNLEDGTLCGLTDLLREITDRKALEADLTDARRQAETAARAKADFLANMSHELRTPLTSIVGFSNLLRAQNGLDGDAGRYAERITAASQALLTLVNDILDFSKLEAGEVTLKARPTALRPMLAEALAMLQPQADAKDVALVLELHDSLPDRVVADPDRMRQVLLNLIGNAVKFTEAGSVILAANYDSGSEALHCEVRDTGAGIAADQLRRLFVRFSQVDGAQGHGGAGTGLGLSISKALVDAMGGQIGVTSQIGAGSRFWFEVPLAQATAPVEAAGEGKADAEAAATARLLIVDDHQTNRDLARAILAPLGCRLAEAADGSAAVALASRQAFDLILMDVRMPGMDGPSAVRAIRAGQGPNRTIPILAFTADAAEEDRAVLLEAGFDDRVLKPVTPAELIASVTNWLSRGEDEDADSDGEERAA